MDENLVAADLKKAEAKLTEWRAKADAVEKVSPPHKKVREYLKKVGETKKLLGEACPHSVVYEESWGYEDTYGGPSDRGTTNVFCLRCKRHLLEIVGRESTGKRNWKVMPSYVRDPKAHNPFRDRRLYISGSQVDREALWKKIVGTKYLTTQEVLDLINSLDNDRVRLL